MTTTDEIIDKLGATLLPGQAAPSPFGYMLVALAFVTAYVACALGVMGIREDIGEKFNIILFDLELLSLVGLVISTLLAAFILSYPDMYQRPGWIFLPLPITCIFIVFLLLEGWGGQPQPKMPEHGMDCLQCIILLALLPAAGLVFRMRKLASTRPKTAGMIAVIAAFAIGSLILRLSEQTDSVAHLAVWHYAPMLGAAMLGVIVGRWTLRW